MKFLGVVLFLVAAVVSAADTPVTFDSPEKRQRYEQLLEELRCLVCQNQSLADSNADLAQDLRDEVYAMVDAGEERRTITDFMIARYGDFVLYKPPVKTTTWLLWAGPALLLLIALFIVYATTRGRRPASEPLSEEERAQARALIDRRDGN